MSDRFYQVFGLILFSLGVAASLKYDGWQIYIMSMGISTCGAYLVFSTGRDRK